MEPTSFNLIKEQWPSVLEHMKREYDISDVSFNMWIAPLVPDHMENGSGGDPVLYLLIPENKDYPDSAQQFRATVTRKYAVYIGVSVEEVTGVHCRLDFLYHSQLHNNKEEKLIAPNARKVDASTLISANLNPRYTFDTFVVGKNNNLAHAAALAVAESPGEIYNPLFIYGGVGLGKTHLMQSVAHFILQKNPSSKILYVTSEVFTNELIEAIRNRNNYSTTEFRNKYRNNDVLLIDDIQFIIGKESTQEEFFHTFNTLYEAKKQIIISSDKPPKELETLEERLRSRFEWGLTVDIQAPDYETRMAILRKKEELDHINIDNEVIQYIAANVKSNIRELEGSLTKVVAKGKLEHCEVNLAMAQDVLKDLIDPDAKPEITPEFILQVVSEHYQVSQADILSDRRSKNVSRPRQVVMYLIREMTTMSYPQIGASLGRDHSTVVHGHDAIEADLKTSTELQNTINVLRRKIQPQ